MPFQKKSRLNRGNCLASVLAVLALAAVEARADTAAYLSFSGAEWNDTSGLSGYFNYTYDGSNTITGITGADIFVTAGTTLQPFEFAYNVNGTTDTIFQPGLDYNRGSFQFYEVYFTGKDGNTQMFLDWSGVSTTGVLQFSGHGNFSSITEDGGSTILSLASTGTSLGGPGAFVPEPGSLGVLALAVSSVPMILRQWRRSRRSAQVAP